MITVTAMITNASLLGIFGRSLNVGQAKVPITTINISPTSAASGMSAINPVANTIKSMRNIEADIPEALPLHPLDMLIID